VKLFLLVLSLPVAAAALLNARREYRVHGRLTLFGLFLVCLMLFVPNLLIDYATNYRLPDSVLTYTGAVIGVLGLALCIAGMVAFRSLSKVLCLDVGSLADTGLYRWGRNPQYIGWLLFLLGFCLTDWSWWCLAALVVVAVSLHLLVLVEEEHLVRVFGEAYETFRKKTPRYLPPASRVNGVRVAQLL